MTLKDRFITSLIYISIKIINTIYLKLKQNFFIANLQIIMAYILYDIIIAPKLNIFGIFLITLLNIFLAVTFYQFVKDYNL